MNKFLFSFSVILLLFGQVFSQNNAQKFVGIYKDCPFHCTIYKLNSDFTFEYLSVGDIYNGRTKGIWKLSESNKIILNFPKIENESNTAGKAKTENAAPDKNDVIVIPDSDTTIDYGFPVNISYTFILKNKSLCELDEDGKTTFCYKKVKVSEAEKLFPSN